MGSCRHVKTAATAETAAASANSGGISTPCPAAADVSDGGAAAMTAELWALGRRVVSLKARVPLGFRQGIRAHGASAIPPAALAAAAAPGGATGAQRPHSASFSWAALEAEVSAPEVFVSVPPRCISVVRGPEAFFSALMGSIHLARRRLLIAALYVGTGEKERLFLKELLQRILSHGQQQPLQVRLLLDFLRSTRAGASRQGPATLLLPLLQQGLPRSSCRVSLFCNPLTCSSISDSWVQQLLQRLLRGMLNHRQKEALGTQHMKCVVCDDLVLLTGANLSAEYFSTRADRCICIRSQPLADAIDGILAAAEAHSFTLLPPQQQHHHRLEKSHQQHDEQRQQQQQSWQKIDVGGVTCVWPETNPSKPPQADPQGFCRSLSSSLSAAVSAAAVGCCPSAKVSSGVSSSSCIKGGTCLVSLSLQAGFAAPPLKGQEMLLERCFRVAAASSAAAASPSAAVASGPTASLEVTSQLLVEAAQRKAGIQVTVASPYLNFPRDFLGRLQQFVQQISVDDSVGAAGNGQGDSSNISSDVSKSNDRDMGTSRLLVITASPEANSFFKSKGLSYWIPHAYAVAAHATCVALNAPAEWAAAASFSKAAALKLRGEEQPDKRLMLMEYARPGWTFHSKGVWVSSSSTTTSNEEGGNSSSSSSGSETAHAGKSSAPSSRQHSTSWLLQESLKVGCDVSRRSTSWGVASLLGSSNLSVRSSERDLELLALLFTRDSRVEQELQKEVHATLLPFCRPVHEATLRNRFPTWLQFAVRQLGLRSLL
ncbi:hypothetical protein Efla_003169 [Eimeria flavescens]